MNVAILGCGSLGGVMAARLAVQQDHKVTVIERDPRISEVVNTKGLTLREGKKTRVCSVRLVEEADGDSFDALILATKSNGLVEAVEKLDSNLAEEGLVITTQNGLVALDLAEVIGDRFLVPGCVLWGASMDAPGVYRITASGPFIIGGLDEQANTPAVGRGETLLSRIFPVTVSPNIRGVLWSKLAVTSTFTAMGAITGLPFGKLAASREIRDIMLTIGRELFEVSRAEGITLESLGGGMNIERFLSDQGYSRFLKHQFMRIIGYKSRDTESSMLDSIRRGRKTEVEFINGRLVEAADRS
ncbi:MAG: 2-dehydropantoate 2-reductase, partial [Spirochaetales bacterium]|nr:2-dehydropantoate 2-reductase [Spirochaetales bacterium]